MDYKYITQDIIDKGTINITSGEIYAEAEQYNDRARQFYRKKKLIENCFPVWCAAQFLLLGYCVFYLNCENDPSVWLTLRMLCSIPYAVLFGWFILKRANRKPLTALLVSLPLPLIAPKLIVLLLANVILAYLYTKAQTELEAEPGYPAFALLRITYRNE